MRRKHFIALAAILFISAIVYLSPEESNMRGESAWLRENTADAIQIGRKFAFGLLNNNRERLISMAIGPASDKVKKITLQPLSSTSILRQLEDKQIDYHIPHVLIRISPLLSDEELEKMELVALEKNELFTIMSFAYKKDEYEIVEIPGKGKMIFAVALRYYKSAEDGIFYKLIRKVANLPLLRNITGRLGSAWKWGVFEYENKYTLSDFLESVLENGDALDKQESDKIVVTLEKMKIGRTVDPIELADFYKYATIGLKNQLDYVDHLYQVGK